MDGRSRKQHDQRHRLPRQSRSWVKGTITLCGLCGFAGWVLWALILGREFGQDWMVFHTAARAYLDGDLGLVLDGSRLTETINQRYVGSFLSSPLTFHPWLYPPHFLLLLLPFGMLSFGASYVLFMAATFSVFTLAVARFTRKLIPSGVALMMFPQSAFAFFAGQNSYLTGAILVGGFGLLGRYPLLGGALLGVASYKPQLFVTVPIALLAARQWKALASAAAMTLALVLASIAVFGIGFWRDWFQLMVAPSETYQAWIVAGRLNGQSVFACAVAAGASVSFGNAIQAFAALLGVVCVGWSFNKAAPADMTLCVLLAAALLVSPHVSSQDSILLAAGSMFLFRRVLRDGPRPADYLVIVAVWLVELLDPPAPVLVAAIPVFLFGAVTPLILCAFMAVTIARIRAPSR
jgi:alpha-1,2-mannosyltransferase